jgi:hypothetical protein
MTLKGPAGKTRFFTLLKNQTLSYFENHLRRRLEAEDSQLNDNDLVDLVIGDTNLKQIPKSSINVRKRLHKATN